MNNNTNILLKIILLQQVFIAKNVNPYNPKEVKSFEELNEAIEELKTRQGQ